MLRLLKELSMTFRYLPDVALADIAFEAESESWNGLFESCALALTDIMVDPSSLRNGVRKEFSLKSEGLDRLLYDFMTEIIYVKDVDSLIFGRFEVTVSSEGTSLKAVAWGDTIDRGRHRLRNDIKAVTMHLFGVKEDAGKWKSSVVLDI